MGLLSGCSEREPITSYVVPKQHVLDAANHVHHAPTVGAAVERPLDKPVGTEATKTRMLAAIIPHGDQQWFFKVTGPADEVAKHAEAFTALIKSVRFSDDAGTKPKWTLPEGWQETPGSGMRFATLRLGSSAEPLDLTVISLPTKGADQSAYTLDNVNRWRGQLQLPPIDKAQLGELAVELKLDGATAITVDLVGIQAPGGGMGRAPFAGGQRGPTAPPRRIAPPAAPRIGYDTPEGWTKSDLSVSRGGVSVDYAAAFKVERDGQSVDITVTPFPAAAASMQLAMINRWRGQIQLGSITQEQLDQETQKIEIGSAAGDYIEMVGAEDAAPQKTILAVTVVAEGHAWFFTLKGESELAEAEKERFEAFVRSVKFGETEEPGDEN